MRRRGLVRSRYTNARLADDQTDDLERTRTSAELVVIAGGWQKWCDLAVTAVHARETSVRVRGRDRAFSPPRRLAEEGTAVWHSTRCSDIRQRRDMARKRQ